MRDRPGQARALAVRVLMRVLGDGRYLDAALSEVVPTSDPQRPLVQELTFGTLRWYHQLAGIARVFLNRPIKSRDRDIHALLLMGLYQLRFLRVAPHAAVDETVAAATLIGKPWANGVLNACLRAYLREPARAEPALAKSEEARYSHPGWLIDQLRASYPSQWAPILDANNARPPMTLRVDVSRIPRDAYIEQLRASGIEGRLHPRSPSAVLLRQAVPVDRLPGFAEGRVSVQDAAAQLAAVFLDAQPGERVLDACAAPGGKAAHMLEHAPVHLTAVDIDADRIQRVRATLNRLGRQAKLVVGDAARPAEWWDSLAYDRILVDAPCSATGVIRRHPDIKLRRQPADLPKLVETQSRILGGVWPCLRPGGKLLYVTCSILPEENQQQVREFLQVHADAEVVPLTPAADLGLQILPGEDDMDGFYYACLRKR